MIFFSFSFSLYFVIFVYFRKANILDASYLSIPNISIMVNDTQKLLPGYKGSQKKNYWRNVIKTYEERH